MFTKLMTELPLSQFDFITDARKLVSEASDCGFRRFEQIYDDACDVGIAIRSHHTGRVERFYLSETKHRDGDVLYWTFKPVNRNLTLTVQIFND